MRGVIKKWVNSALLPFGVQLVASADDERQALVQLLQQHSIDHVVDIGANNGQFAGQLLEKGYQGRIHCFEPLKDAHAVLAARFEGNERVAVMPRTALGAKSGTVQINVAGNSVSSSVRPMLSAHEDAAAKSAYVGTEDVAMTTFDTAFENRSETFSEGLLLKIDTQGHEAEVLAGAVQTLPQCKAVLIEMSTTPLYAGQALWDELHATLTGAGFQLWNLMPDFRDKRTGQLLQFDGLYLRK
jgi:FkbM family methyltransferase